MFHLFLVPVVFVHVALAPCPAYAPVPDDRGVLMYYSCYDPQTNTIYLARQDRHDRMTFAHEMGHAFGYTIGRRGEYFAERYAECAVLSPYRNRSICRWLLSLRLADFYRGTFGTGESGPTSTQARPSGQATSSGSSTST